MANTIEVIAALQGIILVVLGWLSKETISTKVAQARNHECIRRIEQGISDLKDRFDDSHKTVEG